MGTSEVTQYTVYIYSVFYIRVRDKQSGFITPPSIQTTVGITLTKLLFWVDLISRKSQR